MKSNGKKITRSFVHPRETHDVFDKVRQTLGCFLRGSQCSSDKQMTLKMHSQHPHRFRDTFTEGTKYDLSYRKHHDKYILCETVIKVSWLACFVFIDSETLNNFWIFRSHVSVLALHRVNWSQCYPSPSSCLSPSSNASLNVSVFFFFIPSR